MSAISRVTNFWEFALFDPLTATMVGGSLLSTAIGTGISAGGSIAAGNNAAALGRYQQQEYAQQGETATATAQRSMLEQQRQTGLVQSKLQAAAGASGASPTSGSTLNLSRQIAGRGEYNALMDLSQGENQSAGLANMGSGAMYQGTLAKDMAPYSAAGSIASGAGSMFGTLSRIKPGGSGGFGGGYPPSAPAYGGSGYY